MFTLLDGRECFYQWDINRQVIVDDPTIKEVHFCNKTDDCSLVVEVKQTEVFADNKVLFVQSVADVPNILLQNDFPIRVYAYCNDGYTKIEEVFKVKSRTKPADYVYEETPIITFNEMLRRIEETGQEVIASIPDAVQEAITQNTELLDTVTIDVTNCNKETSTPIEVTDDIRRFVDSCRAGKDVLAFLKNADGQFPGLVNVHDSNTQYHIFVYGTPTYIYGRYEDTYPEYYRYSIQMIYTKEDESIRAHGFRKEVSRFATEEYVDNAIANIDIPEQDIDLSDYYTKAETNAAIEQAIDGIEIPEVDLTPYATQQFVLDKVAEIDIPESDVDLSDYYTKAETDAAIYNSKDTYYLDFSSATEAEQPATADIIEFATRFIAGQNVCAHARINESGNAAKGYQPVTVQKLVGNKLRITTNGLDPINVAADNPCRYYSYIVRADSTNGWVYCVENTHSFAIATHTYVAQAIADSAQGETDLSNYYTKDEVNALFNGIATAEGGSY